MQIFTYANLVRIIDFWVSAFNLKQIKFLIWNKLSFYCGTWKICRFEGNEMMVWFYFIECFMTTFLRAHSWLNWVDEDDDDDEVGLKEKPEDTRYIKKITSK